MATSVSLNRLKQFLAILNASLISSREVNRGTHQNVRRSSTRLAAERAGVLDKFEKLNIRETEA